MDKRVSLGNILAIVTIVLGLIASHFANRELNASRLAVIETKLETIQASLNAQGSRTELIMEMRHRIDMLEQALRELRTFGRE